MTVRASVACWAISLLFLSGSSRAADKKKADDSGSQRETVAKPLSEKEKRKREEKLRKELETPYRKWLDEDVTYIITDEERQAFKRLATDEERDQFIEQFWLRRDPTPDSAENEFKEEHYRRIAYANERYASGIPGWKTDRGRIYIMYGAPDENESHPSGGTYERPYEEGGGTTSTYPFEIWRYRYLEGIGSDILIEFVDPTMTGEYRMTMDPSEKDALLYVPGAGLTMLEQMGMASKNDRFNRTDGTHLGIGNTPTTERMKVRADFMRMTDSTVLVPLTIQFENRDLQFQNKDGLSKAVVNIYMRVTSMARRPVAVQEDVVSVESLPEQLEAASKRSSVYQKAFFLAPGTYRLNVVAKDVVGGNMNNYEMALHVPRYEEEKLASSNIILADLIEKVPTRSVGTGQFVIGSSKVRPRLSESFRNNEKLGIYAQFYNFGADEKTHKPAGTVELEVVKNGSNEKIAELSEDINTLPGASAQQVTVEKQLSLAQFAPGQYTLRMKVTDKLRNQVLTPTATFSVN